MMSHQKFTVPQDAPIRSALENINSSGLQIAVLVDTDGRLVGTASDGDIRRGLLRGLTLESPVIECANREPSFVNQSTSDADILHLLKQMSLHQMPVVDERGKLVDLKLFDTLVEKPKFPNLVVLMVGGLGKRLGDLTRNIPKPMLPIGGRPILETIVDNFREQGFYRFRFALNYKSDIIESHFGNGSNFDCEFEYLREPKRMGTAGALSLLDEQIDSPVIVSNGDLLVRLDAKSLLEHHTFAKAQATMVVREFEYQIPYGVVRVDGQKIRRIEEKPVHRYLVAGGVYVLSPEALKLVPKDTFFDMPSLFDRVIEQGGHASTYGLDGYWLDIGRSADYEQAQRDFSQYFGVK